MCSLRILLTCVQRCELFAAQLRVSELEQQLVDVRTTQQGEVVDQLQPLPTMKTNDSQHHGTPSHCTCECVAW